MYGKGMKKGRRREGDRQKSRGRGDRETDRQRQRTNPNRLSHSFLTHFQLVSNFIDLSSDTSQRNIKQGVFLSLFVKPVNKKMTQ